MSNIKAAIRRLPVLGGLAVNVLARIRAVRDQKTLALLSNTSYSQAETIKQVILQVGNDLPSVDRDWIVRIEEQRNSLLRRHDPLVDGSLGESGLYDGDKTISMACMVSKPPEPALVLYLLVRAIKPKTVIELGTNVGISSSFIAAALQQNGENGRLVTLESSPYRLKVAREVHRNLGLDNVTYVQGLFADTLDDTLSRMGSVDLAFIDGHHLYKPTLDYYEQIFPAAAPDGVFVFDDIRWSEGMVRAWSEIKADQRIGLAVDLDHVGICVKAAPDAPKRYVFPALRTVIRNAA
mgnify:CR=1 FL=1